MRLRRILWFAALDASFRLRRGVQALYLWCVAKASEAEWAEGKADDET